MREVTLRTMEVDLQFSVGAALRRAQIVPRSDPYLLEEIQEALRNELSSGKNVQINCLTDKKTKQTLLGDVRMCFDRKFQPIDCPHVKSSQPLTYILGHPPPLPSFKSERTIRRYCALRLLQKRTRVLTDDCSGSSFI
ncbi:hypothetical protein ANCDUO_14318 [Ancylostoma duodenale]|uniref:Uncharacterized protein n=1 Tax=Ancylostoma duodenale TaxID=51022 RepID=A0A0C2G9H8_9BILA|nr:hypothetical protein ANCDUO_14318 [Ancylostoma duodenale]